MALIDNLVGYWKLNEGSGSIIDAHGSSDGTYNGALYSQSGKINTSIGFDGSNDLIDFADYNFFDAFSVSMWVYHDVTGSQDDYISNDISNTAPRGLQLFKGVTDKVTFYDGDTGNLETTDTLSAATWYHIVFTWDGTNRRIYIGGTQKATDSGGNINNVTKNLVFGTRFAGNAHHDGRMDEVGIWSRTISASEVSELNNSNNGLAYPFSVATTRLIKLAGTFVAKPILTKVGGTFVDKPIKIKVGGVFQDA